MNKAQLIEKAVESGIDASGTVKELKDRLEAYRLKPQVVVSASVKESPARKEYRNGAHVPKVRKGARNLQVKSND